MSFRHFSLAHHSLELPEVVEHDITATERAVIELNTGDFHPHPFPFHQPDEYIAVVPTRIYLERDSMPEVRRHLVTAVLDIVRNDFDIFTVLSNHRFIRDVHGYGDISVGP
jgi:hypothetical protein